MESLVKHNIQQKTLLIGLEKITEKFTLVMELGNDSFSAIVIDPSTNILHALVKYEFHATGDAELVSILQHLLQQNDFLRIPFRYNFISWVSPQSTLVPIALYKSDQKNSYLQFNHSVSQNAQILTDDLRLSNAKCIYSIQSELKSFLDKQFPNHRLKHHSGILIESILSRSNKKEKNFNLNIRENHMDIVICEESLLFSNSFQFQSSEDLLYFVLFTMEQNKCDPHVTDCIITGDVEVNSPVHNMLKQYIKNIYWGVPHKKTVKQGKFSEIPEHYHFTLLNRLFCE